MAAPGRPLAIVDIDGVVADVRHRLHHLERRPKDWKRFFAGVVDDPPHPRGLALVAELAEQHDVVFLTGRPAHLRRATQTWLDTHGLGRHRLLMRPEGDRRPAAVVKVEALARLIRERDVAVVVDDDPLVLQAVAGAGFRTITADWERRDGAGTKALLDAQEHDGRT